VYALWWISGILNYYYYCYCYYYYNILMRAVFEKCYITVKGLRNIIHTAKRRKGNWIGHIWRRNCLLKQVIEGKVEGRIEVTGRRYWMAKDKTVHWKLRKEALDHTVWRTGFGRGCGLVVRQATE
jgi:hypothetical protein